MWLCDNDVCITTIQPDFKSDPNPNIRSLENRNQTGEGWRRISDLF